MKRILVCKLLFADVTRHFFLLNNMNEPFVDSHAILGGEELATESALDILHLDMRHLHVVLQTVTVDEDHAALATGRSLLLFMDHPERVKAAGLEDIRPRVQSYLPCVLPLGDDCVERFLARVAVVFLCVWIMVLSHAIQVAAQ